MLHSVYVAVLNQIVIEVVRTDSMVAVYNLDNISYCKLIGLFGNTVNVGFPFPVLKDSDSQKISIGTVWCGNGRQFVEKPYEAHGQLCTSEN